MTRISIQYICAQYNIFANEYIGRITVTMHDQDLHVGGITVSMHDWDLPAISLRALPIVSVRYGTCTPCTGIMYTVYYDSPCSSSLRRWVMRCGVRAAAAQIEIREYSWGSTRYEGQVDQHGKRHGQGVRSGADGYRYEGAWREHSRHGHGTATYRDGTVKSGRWENGSFRG